MTVRLKSGEVVAWSPADDGPVQDVPPPDDSISAQLSLSTPAGSMVTEAMTMAYDPAEPRGKGGEWIGLSAKDYEGTVGDPSHITRSEHGLIPLSAIAGLQGARGEKPGDHPNRQGQKWEDFKADIAANGIKNPVFVTVDHGQEPKISEGNHRRDAAAELGMTHVPAEVRYYGHAEQQGTVTERARHSGASLATQLDLAFNPAEPRGPGGEWITLFHGTVESNIEGISGKGLNPAPGNIGIASVAHTLTDTREDAETYARNRAAGWLTPKVVEFRVPAKQASRYLYQGDAYGADAKATGYALRKNLPSKFIHAVHDVAAGPTKLQFGGDTGSSAGTGDTTYESTEATLARIRAQLNHAVDSDAVAAITDLADTLPAALPDDPETVGHVADGQVALADAQAALQRAVDAAQAALKSHELNNGPAHEAAQSAGGAPEREYVTGGAGGLLSVELAYNPAESRGPGGEWMKTEDIGKLTSDLEPDMTVEQRYQRFPAKREDETQRQLDAVIAKRGWHPSALQILNGNRLTDGHHTYAAARKRGIKTLPVVHYVRPSGEPIQASSSLASQIELAFNPAEPRGKGGEWDKVGEDDAKETYLAPISDVEKLADQQKLRDVTGTDVANDLESKIRSNGFDHSRALVIDTYANGSMGLGDGYHRLAAARSAGLKTIPVHVYRNTAAGRRAANRQTMVDEAASTRNLRG